MSHLRIMPFAMGSQSAKDLAQLLNVLRIYPDGEYVPKLGAKIINWGYSGTPVWMERARNRSVTILNNPSNVNIAANKLTAFRRLAEAGVRTPEFTTSIHTASDWVNGGFTVLERHSLRGNSGEGIRIVNLDDDSVESTITSAPLYTKFIPKVAEFRVHVFRGQVIDYIEKKKTSSERRPENFNRYVSSVHQGWVFARTNIREIDSVKQIAIDTTRALGLDFAAVDIVYYNDLPYVLEANTAPGLTGTTLYKYANAIRRYMGQPDLALPQTTPVTQNIPATPIISSPVVSDLVTLQVDRTTALKLKELLSRVV